MNNKNYEEIQCKQKKQKSRKKNYMWTSCGNK